MAHLYYQFYLIDVRRNMVVCNEAYKIFQWHINLGKFRFRIVVSILLNNMYYSFSNTTFIFIFPFTSMIFPKHDKGCNETQPNAKPQRERVPNIIISSCITLFQLKNNKEYRKPMPYLLEIY